MRKWHVLAFFAEPALTLSKGRVRFCLYRRQAACIALRRSSPASPRRTLESTSCDCQVYFR